MYITSKDFHQNLAHLADKNVCTYGVNEMARQFTDVYQLEPQVSPHLRVQCLRHCAPHNARVSLIVLAQHRYVVFCCRQMVPRTVVVEHYLVEFRLILLNILRAMQVAKNR